MNEFRYALRVYIEDTDAGGIVYYANYLKYMERARTEYWRSLGYTKPALFDGLQLVVRDVSVRYLKPAELDDHLQVSAELTAVSRVSFEMNQAVYRGDQLLARGTIKGACIGEVSKRPERLPTAMFDSLKSHIV